MFQMFFQIIPRRASADGVRNLACHAGITHFKFAFHLQFRLSGSLALVPARSWPIEGDLLEEIAQLPL
jgi:hypothetical protein